MRANSAARMMTRSTGVKPPRESDEESTILPAYENVISAQQQAEQEKVPAKMSSEEKIHNQTVEFLDKYVSCLLHSTEADDRADR